MIRKCSLKEVYGKITCEGEVDFYYTKDGKSQFTACERHGSQCGELVIELLDGQV